MMVNNGTKSICKCQITHSYFHSQIDPVRMVAQDCKSSGYVNNWDGWMDYTVPDGRAIRSMYSEYSPWYK